MGRSYDREELVSSSAVADLGSTAEPSPGPESLTRPSPAVALAHWVKARLEILGERQAPNFHGDEKNWQTPKAALRWVVRNSLFNRHRAVAVLFRLVLICLMLWMAMLVAQWHTNRDIILDFQAPGAYEVAWSPDGKLLALGSNWVRRTPEKMSIWRASDGQFQRSFEAYQCVAWSRSGEYLAALGKNGMNVWRLSDGLAMPPPKTQTCVTWSPDWTLFASIGEQGTSVNIWRASDGAVVGSLVRQPRQATHLAWSPDGKRLASGWSDGSVSISDPASGRVQRNLPGHGDDHDEIRALAWSPDGGQLACASYGGTVRIWQPTEGKLLWVLEGHSGGVSDLKWSPPNGTRLASGSSDGTVRIWETATGRLVQVLHHAPLGLSFLRYCPVASIDWSPDGTRLTSVADDEVRIWRVPSR